MNACNELLFGWLKDVLRFAGTLVGVLAILLLVFFFGVKAHVEGQLILDTLPAIESVEPLPEKASAPAVSLTTIPFKGVL